MEGKPVSASAIIDQVVEVAGGFCGRRATIQRDRDRAILVRDDDGLVADYRGRVTAQLDDDVFVGDRDDFGRGLADVVGGGG